MVNLAVQHRRPNYALQTLVKEVTAAYGTPYRWPEYITGYKSATNITGHNPDNNGIIHGTDLFFRNGEDWTEARGEALAEWLRTVEGPKGAIPGHPDRMYYIIYGDQRARRDRIAGDMTGWDWVYRDKYEHPDHIHISTVDLYWGDPVSLPAGDYDSTAPWGFSSLAPAGGTITELEKTMAALTDEQQHDLHYVLAHPEGREILGQLFADVLLRTRLKMNDGGTPTLHELLAADNDRLHNIQAFTKLIPSLDTDLRGEADIERVDRTTKDQQLAGISSLLLDLKESDGVNAEEILATLAAGLGNLTGGYELQLVKRETAEGDDAPAAATAATQP